MTNLKLNASKADNAEGEGQEALEAADDVNEGEEQVEVDPVQKELQTLKAQMSEFQKNLEQERARAKDLGAKLTKEQQLRAEWERYHTATLPELNRRAAKTFEEKWNDNPEEAIEAEVTSRVKPVVDQSARTNAELWKTQIMVANPDLAKYEARVVELSLEDPSYAALTYSKSGIERLFRMAEAEDLRKERDELKQKLESGNGRVDKERVYTEGGSSPRSNTNPNKTPRLTPAQMEIAKKLRIAPENYLKRIPQVKQIGEMEND